METHGGQRFFAPTFWQRLYLFWLFRNFRRLPLKVLGESERVRVERMCSQPGVAGDPDLVLGVVEWEIIPPKKAAQSAPLYAQTSTAKRAR